MRQITFQGAFIMVVVGLAMYDAGPKVVGEPCLKRLFGSDPGDIGVELPPMPKCNTIDEMYLANCPRSGGKPCVLMVKKMLL
jgi:hypothetical protein